MVLPVLGTLNASATSPLDGFQDGDTFSPQNSTETFSSFYSRRGNQNQGFSYMNSKHLTRSSALMQLIDKARPTGPEAKKGPRRTC